MTEFKTLDNGIELFYSNYQILNDKDFQVIVRAERWNSEMLRYEGLDVILPSGEINNIEYLKSNQVEEFKESVFQNQDEIIRLAKEDSFLEIGDDLIDLSNYQREKLAEGESLNSVIVEEIDIKDNIGIDNNEEDSFLKRLFAKFSL